MDISYLGHSAFRLKSKDAIVITDPFEKTIGFSMPSLAADIVTVSHDHYDHNYTAAIKPVGEKQAPFVISAAGEYEVGGVSIFGYASFHDAVQGNERGKNIVYSIHIDGINIVHLGDLGHTLTEGFIENLGEVDVLLCPVGGKYTIDAKTAVEIIQEIEPSFVIPMHFRTDKHEAKTFGELQTLADFEKEFGLSAEPVKSLTVSATTKPEQTTLVVLSS